MQERLVICVCTFRRADGLRELFGSFVELKVGSGLDLSIVVVDNDEVPSSQDIVGSLSEDLDWPVRYVHEPEPGIPSARNRAIREAGTEGYMVFVDDDETVDPNWVSELITVINETQASFVQGPMVMKVDDPDDAWFLDTALYKQKTFPDRTKRHESWTNNVAIDLGFLSQTGCKFDNALRFDGGSDTLFFQDIVREGGKGVFAAKAIVFEVQPKSRLSWRWAIRRQYRYGMTRANTMRLRSSRISALSYCVIRGGAMMMFGLGHLLTGIVRGRKGIANGMAYIARGCGVWMGCLGARRLEYAR